MKIYLGGVVMKSLLHFDLLFLGKEGRLYTYIKGRMINVLLLCI
jgi:hypothetical protein